MSGCRALTNEEIVLVEQALVGARNKALFTLGVATGLRVSEIVTIPVKNIFQHGKVTDRVTIDRKNIKGKKGGRSVVLTDRAKLAISNLIKEECLTEDMFLFPSRKGGHISRKQAWRILTDCYASLELQGKVSTHSMRKSLAVRVWEASGKDIRKTQIALGHANIQSTISYLGVDTESVDQLVMDIDAFKIS